MYKCMSVVYMWHCVILSWIFSKLLCLTYSEYFSHSLNKFISKHKGPVK